MIVVSNSTPLIGLASIGRFDLLHQLFGNIQISTAVFDETVSARRELSASWVKIIPVTDRLAVEVMLDDLDIGEAETIILAREIKADWVLMDEKKGRRKLSTLGMPKIGTLGILLKAKQEGLLSTLRPDIEHLRQQGFSVSSLIVDAILEEAGEFDE